MRSLIPYAVAAVTIALVSPRVASGGEVLSASHSAVSGPEAHPPAGSPAEAIRRWQSLRFGMFIHWGPVSLKGTEIGWSRGAEVPVSEYDRLYTHFNPTRFDAAEWVSVARAAGARYIIFTTKHHDGFCMFATRQTDFNVMNSPFRRDVVKELAAACKAQGVAFGTYHSVCDWRHPDFPLGSPGGRSRKPHPDLDRYEGYLKAQVGELIRNYGPLLTMWFDVPQEFSGRRGESLLAHTRALQPDIVINDRSGAGGDYETPEQHVGGFRFDRPWETCMTIGHQWSWKPRDEIKSLKTCLHTLISCAGGDGNLLFNVGPRPTGEIEPQQVARLKEMGAWLRRNGESIYDTRGGPYVPGPGYVSTRRGRTIYVHVLGWPGDSVTIPPFPGEVVTSSLLSGEKVEVRATGRGIVIKVPARSRDEIDTVIKLVIDRDALALSPIPPQG